MEPSAAEETNLMSFTPSLVKNLLQDFEQTCHDSSIQRLYQSSKALIVDVTVADLLQLGSTVIRDIVRDVLSCSDGTIMASLPALKPMIEECVSVAISQFISEVIKYKCRQGPDPSVEVGNQSVKSEVISEDEEKFHPGDDSAAEERPSAPETNSVAEEDNSDGDTCTRRGVRCQLCRRLFKRSNAVDALLKHTKEVHPEKATASFLRLLRRNNGHVKVM